MEGGCRGGMMEGCTVQRGARGVYGRDVRMEAQMGFTEGMYRRRYRGGVHAGCTGGVYRRGVQRECIEGVTEGCTCGVYGGNV